jgi:hypothetical protein
MYSYEKEIVGKELKCNVSIEMERIENDNVEIDCDISEDQIHQGSHSELTQEV